MPDEKVISFKLQDTSSKILIVEDSAVQAEMLRRLLIHEGYEVIIAKDGREGIEAVQMHKPSLILSDINMPVMDGYEMCVKIKQDEALKDIPLILLTQLFEPEEVLRGIEAGADAYITKPYEDEYLLSMIKVTLENPRGFINNPSLKSVDFEYHGKRYSVHSGRAQTLSYLISSYESALMKNMKLVRTQDQLKMLNETLDEKVTEKTAELEAIIEDKKRTEHILKSSENRFRALVHSAPIVILQLSPEGKILEFNPEAEKIYGCKREDALGKDYVELFIPSEAREGVREDIKKVFSGIPAKNYENPVKTSGGIRLYSWNVNMVIDDKGTHLGIVATGIDVTWRKEAEDTMLRQNKELFSFVNLSNELLSVPLTGDVYHAICREAVSNFGLRMAWLGLIEEGSSEIKTAAFSGVEDGYLSISGITGVDSQAGRTIRAKTSNVVNSIDSNPLYLKWRKEALKRGYHSSMALPLVATDGRVVGVLNLYSGEKMFFSERLTYIFEAFSNQASVTIENANLIKNLRQKIEEITAADKKLRAYVEDLETFKKAAIKRELRMAEMKERMERLEKSSESGAGSSGKEKR